MLAIEESIWKKRSYMSTTLVCPYCKSDEIVRDATAKQNPDTGEWELAGVQDAVTCEGCGRTEIDPILACAAPTVC